MSKQPTITLNTPSCATVELIAHSNDSIRYTATLCINNAPAAYIAALTTHEVDDNQLFMDYTVIALLAESAERATAFFAETASYVAGKQP